MLSVSVAVLACVATMERAAAQPAAAGRQTGSNQPAVGAGDIAGVVRGLQGPEAGVWVTAQTRDLPTKYVKIVATDDMGRYLIPDLPGATYDIWVRGYGLVDSPKVKSTPGKSLNLKAVAAPNRAAAAQYYPAIYWYSMLNIPDARLFPGTGVQGNGMSQLMTDQGLWLRYIKTDSCAACHQLGDKATRTIEPELGHFDTSVEAWERRLQSGPASATMMNSIGRLDTPRALAAFAGWTDRIAAGALPRTDPPRPAGKERNIVITEWDWSTPTTYLHDEISTDRRNPTVNAHGIIYGSPEESSDFIPWLDPVDNKAGLIKSEYRDPNTPTTKKNPIYAPSVYWGTDKIWDSHTNIHNPMFDENGRLWLTARIRGPADPAFCKEGSNHPSAKAFPLERSGRQVEMLDPKTKKLTLIDLCFGTHHLQFDKDGVLWFSGGGQTVGWFDVKKFDATHDEQAAQGWSPFVLDTSGNGKRDAGWTEPGKPFEPGKDMRIAAGFYGVAPNPADGSVWGSITGFPGALMRYDPKTQLSEYYQVPWKTNKVPAAGQGFSPRGMDITTDGVVWTVLASGHLASFDRRLCKGPLNGPVAADPQHCAEGWKLHQMPGPTFENLPQGSIGASAEAPYYVWVDQHDTLGLGKNVPIATGNESDSLVALVDGKFMVMRVPYPMGFFAKGLDGRIDDAGAGWKGRGLWSLYSDRSTAHIEGGKGETSKVVHFQLRPDPLAQ
jgi:streptogramin lyase